MAEVATQGHVSAPAYRPGRLVAREVLAPVAFVAAALASGYALAWLPGVQFLDLMVFVAAYTLGLRRGLTVAAATWLVYGTYNPWGPTHGALLITVMASEAVYALAGAGVRRLLAPSAVALRPSRATPLLAAAALLATGLYDVLTNLYTGYFWALTAGSADYARWLWVALTNPGALFFMAMHAGSNAALFPVFGPLLIKAADHARERWGW